MGYWMRVYSRADEVMEVETIEGFFEGEPVAVELCSGDRGANWRQIELAHKGGEAISLIELDHVEPGGETALYVEEDIAEVLETEPRQNAEWVAEFLRGVKRIYSFQILSGAHGNEDFGFDCVRDLQEELMEPFDGILYAEGEGYSNQQGSHITWEFDDGCEGEWYMALYDAKSQTWTRFVMELSDPAHQAAFRAGRVPKGVKVT